MLEKEKTIDPAPVMSQVGDLSLFEGDLDGLDDLAGLDLEVRFQSSFFKVSPKNRDLPLLSTL